MINQVVSFLASTEPPQIPDRVDDGIEVLYLFREGTVDLQSTRIFDVSGSGNPLPLDIANVANVEWDAVQGVRTIGAGTIFESEFAASKIINAVKASNEITLESWLRIDDPDANGPARIMTVSSDGGLRGATLGQNGFNSPATGDYFYTIRMNTTAAAGSGNLNGLPELQTDERYQAGQIQHVVYTRDAAGIERIYVNGVIVETGSRGGDLSSWANNYKLALANEIGEGRSFLGTLLLSAVFSRALTDAEVLQNTQARYTNILPKLFAPATPFLISSTPTSLTIRAATSFSAENDVYELFADSGLTNLVEIQTVPQGDDAVFTGLAPSTQYWWRAKSTSTQGRDSNYSITVTGSTPAPNSVPVVSNVVLTVEENRLMEDTFTGTVIDNQKWNIVSPNVQITQNGVLTLTDSPGGVASTLEQNRIESVDTFSGSDFIVAQCNLDFSPQSGLQYGFALWIDSDNFVAILNNVVSAQDTYLTLYKKDGVLQFDDNTTITHGKDVRIIKDLSGVISFQYWDGAAWAQLATDIAATIFPILPSDQLKVAFISQSTFQGTGLSMTVDNVFMVKRAYSSRFPPNGAFVLNGSYEYFDADGDPEASSARQLIRDDDGAGTNRGIVSFSPDFPYPTTPEDEGKTFYYNVRPFAASGASPGVAVESAGVQIPASGPQRLGLIADNNGTWTNHFWAGNDPFIGDSSMEFMVGNPLNNAPQVIVGLDTVNPGSSNPNACLYNFYWIVGANQLNIRTNGTNLKNINNVNLTTTDVLRIVRSGSNIQFWVRGVLEHTVTGGSTAALFTFGTMVQSGPSGRFEKYAITIPKVAGAEIQTFSSISNISEVIE